MAIEAHDLVMDYGTKRALDGVSFSVPAGSFFGVFGPNGAGKTTLINILTGLMRPTGGEARVLGMDPSTDPLAVRSAIGIVPEVESPPSYLTASEFLTLVARVRGVDEGSVGRWLREFDLEAAAGTLCRDLSKGMRQKVLIASALIHRPGLLLLDEPFINLDPLYQRRLRELLSSLQAEGTTIVLCSHILEIAQRLCDEAIIVDQGRVVGRYDVRELESRGEDLETVFMRTVCGDA